MSFIKKNLLFCLIILICLLAFGAGAFLAIVESGKVSDAQKQIKSAESQLQSLLVADPAPTSENVAASEQNVMALETALKKIRDDLQRGSSINASSDGVGVMSAIQQHITEYQRKATEVVNKEGEPAPVVTPAKFAFGFEKYIDRGMLDDSDPVAKLDKQRQILSYIIDQLFASNPVGIQAVERELLEGAAETSDDPDSSDKGFRIDDATSARVPGAIDTMGFSVTFTGYTGSLRSFLNNLADFELPIVVRGIEVKRPAGKATTAAASKSKKNSMDDIFGAFGGSSSPAADAPVVEAQKPVISENISSFTVLLEFIEVVLPSDSEKNPS
ncbi:MAG: hypothetical protein ACSHX8_12360 [Opitutaceae bacterium]